MKNIDFKEQYKFEDCKFYNKLPFDFYLPQYNICIEYDGEFHSTAERNKGELKVVKERDERKDSRADDLGIPIIRISYREQNHITEPWLREHIEEYLGKIWN